MARGGGMSAPATLRERITLADIRIWRVTGINNREALVTGPYSAGAAVRLAELGGVVEGRAELLDPRQVWTREIGPASGQGPV